MLLALLAAHAAAGVLVLALARRLGRWGLVGGGLAPALTVAWVAARATTAWSGSASRSRITAGLSLSRSSGSTLR